MMLPHDAGGGEAELTLPPRFAAGARQVLAAAENALKAAEKGRTTPRVRRAFADLAAALSRAEPELLLGRPAEVWKEYAARLANDAAEGRTVETPEDLARVADSLRANADALRTRLDLGEQTAASVPASRPSSRRATGWTCAMHPQVRSSHPGKCPLCGMALIPVAGAGGGRVRSDE
jgi:hypothetical protein